MDTFDAIVIGAGKAGVEVANRAVKAEPLAPSSARFYDHVRPNSERIRSHGVLGRVIYGTHVAIRLLSERRQILKE